VERDYIDELQNQNKSGLEILVMKHEKQANPSRRELLASLAAGAAALGLPLAEIEGAEGSAAQRKLKIVVAGAHPDDPELSAGGTIARYTDLGHEVVCLYLTRGDMGEMKEKMTPQQTAALRSSECEKACAILKARPRFVGQIDAATEVNPARYDEFFQIIADEKPDLVFTHWPVDPHRDHRATSLLVYDAWLKGGRKFELFYFEIKAGLQTQLFKPTHYVDITATEDRKKQASYAHSHGQQVYETRSDLMNRFRGLECGCKFAEAFALHPRSATGTLP
jgi:LmbE family N-acetylglucosaminyl deacetylase